MNGTGTASPASLLSASRASTGYAQWADGHWLSFASNQPRITDQGLLTEQAATNLALWCRDLTNANWTPSNVTTALDQTGIDGTANSASSVTATANNGTLTAAAITSASASRSVSMFVKRITGTGAVSISQDGGSTFTAITTKVGASWYRPTTLDFSGLTQTVTNPQIVIKLGTSGDKIAVDFVDLEAGTFLTSPILTTTAAATRAADAITLKSQILNALPVSQGTILASFSLLGYSGLNQGLVSINDGTASNHVDILASYSGGTNTRVLSGGGGSDNGDVIPGAASAGVLYRIGTAWGSNSLSCVLGSGSIVADATANSPSSISAGLIGRTVYSSTQAFSGTIKRLAFFKNRMPDSQLKSLVNSGNW